MRIAIQNFYTFLKTLKNIQELEIEKRFRNQIRETWLRVFYLRRYDSRNNLANIVTFKVRFLNYSRLSYLYNEIFIKNEYHFVAENASPFIIDCGSNIGLSVLYFKMLYPHSRLLSFEPGEEAFTCLEENVKQNLLKSVEVHQAALCSKDGDVDFYFDESDPGSLRMSTKQDRMHKQRRSVRGSVLSKYIDEEIDFLKMDIEGSELEVLEELHNARKLSYVKQMVIEYHHHIVKESDTFSRILRILEDVGFGYQIEGQLWRPLRRKQYQDILVYAYRKRSTSKAVSS